MGWHKCKCNLETQITQHWEQQNLPMITKPTLSKKPGNSMTSITKVRMNYKFYFMGWSGWSSTTKNGVLTVYYSSEAVTANDFDLSLSGGAATLTNSTPSSITVSGTKVTLGIQLQGIADGNETLTVSTKANSIYDTAGNQADSNTVSFTLNDKIPSFISATVLTEVNTQVLVTFSEEINTFSNWGGGEPNDVGTENYGHLTGSGQFNDHRANMTMPTLVEIDSETTSLGQP